MKTFGLLFFWVFAVCSVAGGAEDLRKERDAMMKKGLWRDALTHYSEKMREVNDASSGDDLGKAVDCIRELGVWAELDPLVEGVVAKLPENAALLRAAASAYLGAPHSGRLIAGEFERGGYGGWRPPGRGMPEPLAGAAVSTAYRDKVRALQLLDRALRHAPDDEEQAACWSALASALNTYGRDAWKLQTLTPIDELPAWDEPGPEGGTEGAPWAGDGPVLFEIPESWEAAENDGERWRFALARKAALKPESAPDVTLELARFSQSQFGTETLSSFGWWREMDPDSAKGLLEMDTLAEDECLAKTSAGVRRFKLPAEHHFIPLYRSVLAERAQAGDALVQVFLNRRQYDKAREVLEETIAKHGAKDGRKELLEQIAGKWMRFLPAATVPAGVRPSLPLVFRNATSVTFTASPVDMEAVLKNTMAWLKSNPRELDWERLHPGAIAQRLIQGKDGKYIGEAAATWTEKLTPREKHRDTSATVEMPVDKAGAWWIHAKVEGGNECRMLVWIVDSVLVEKDVGGRKQWWVADAETGEPVEGAEIDFFGYRTVDRERKNPLARRMDVRTKAFARKTDAEGRILLKPGSWDEQFRWLAVARKEGRAPAFFGFQHLGMSESRFEKGNRDLSYGISDRPLYKPGDTVHLKFYLRNVGYFEPDEARFANKNGELILRDGRGGESVKISDLRTDALGAVEAEVVIPKDAALGAWHAMFTIPNKGSAQVSFRVEEYRKPEYEVSVEAPAEPVKLGERFTATIKANYFHGAPVRNARVEIMVKRSSIGERWFPVHRWDWLYGRGAWWGAPEASWHPTWPDWRCFPPSPPWWGEDRWTPDEIVLRQTVDIGQDGTAKVEVDTALAEQTHGDLDAKYIIEARVTDASRREESGTGEVIAARKPFEVVVWTNRGFAHTGDEVEANIAASTLAGKPVSKAKGELRLFKLSAGDDGRIEENEVAIWPLETDAEGRVVHKFAAPAAGQYRLAATLSLDGGEVSEGGVILNVHGPGRSDPEDWKFGPIELVADKTEYAAGETMKLRVNSDRTDAHVWLFLHIAGNVGREAKLVRLDGKSLEVGVPLDRRDMPNMFVEAITVHGARVHTAVRQVLLPPDDKMIDVSVEPAAARVKPRDESKVRIVLRDAEGKPVRGEAVIAVYDKALEAITGGSNVPPIRENFWSWKNHYHGHGNSHSLPSSSGNLVRPKAKWMEGLGRFGDEAEPFGGPGGEGGGLSSRSSMDVDAFAESAPVPATAALDVAGKAAPAEILVRGDFADLLKWAGSVKADENGVAEVPLEFPDNLTTWKVRVWTLTEGTRVGEGTAEIIASKELLVRLQAPRFLVERDEAVFSAVVHNDHDVAKTVNVSLELEGGTIEAIDGAARTVEIAARSEARVDWRVKALREGEAVIRMKADAGDDGDAVERRLPVVVHGMLRQDAWSRTVPPGEDTARIELEVPEQRRADQTKLTVRVSPTIAGAVVDAIPYLADYPHGCTEQTLNRFVPAVIAQGMLRDLGINLAEVKAKRNNLNPQELGDPETRAERWRQWAENPVFDEVELERMVSAGIKRLEEMRNADGGWGWFSGYGEVSYPHTTAVVVHGLLTAKAHGAEVPDDMLAAGVAWLAARERKETEALQRWADNEALRKAGTEVKRDGKYEKSRTDSLDAFVRMVLGGAGRDSEPMLAFLHRDRLELPVYAKCLVGLEHHRKEDEARRDEMLALIGQFLKRDAENQTAWLEMKNGGYWWFWYGSEVEAHAWYLKLLSAVRPDHEDTRGLAKYLVNNRAGGRFWKSTRDTAYAVEAIAAYFKASGEEAPEMEVEVLMDGGSLRKLSITRENLFTFDGTITLHGEAVSGGKHVVELRKSGKGTLYANAYLEVFTLEDKLRAAGLEVKVSRNVSKLVPLEKSGEVPDADGLVVTQRVERYRREPLADGAALASGDRIEVELVIESKNDYEYLIFSDAKAAGFESVEALSGYMHGGSGFSAYMEPRERTVDFFIRSLPRGTHTLRYQLRAEAPGNYKALPAVAEAMYAPELRANSEDIRLIVSP